ncbi:MAG: twin-arginine translocation signal domain-containing protein [Aquificota bacterium]|nr:MAG: twin-arginine translocation signal domain-containing protein [Aquificota bacterium]
MALSRRDFLKALGASGAGITLGGNAAFAKQDAVVVEDPRHSYPNTSYTENMYRNEFAFTYGEKEDHGTAYHCVNCQGNCAWDVWVNNGIITRENQVANYTPLNPKIPDFNPRGCNKGVQHSHVTYEKDRILYPLKRVGKRGEGKWKRITWDEAITEVAKNIYETMLTKGPEGLFIHVGAGMLTEGRGAAGKRLGTLLGAVRNYIASYVGDMFPGVTVVYGEGNIGCSYDFFYTTNVNIWWGQDPNKTRIPDAHFLWEGKYNGAKNIVITPDFNASCVHADLWVPVRSGYDGFLAMAIINEIIQKKLYKPKFVKHFTDLPFLVRLDNKKLLRLSDIDPEKSPEFDKDTFKVFEERGEGKEFEPESTFFSWNTKTNKLTVMPGTEGAPVKTLRLKDVGWDIDPALEGTWEVTLKDGKKVKVTTVFELVKKEAAKFSAEKTWKLTGVHPTIVEQLAKDIALPKVVMISMGFTIGKYFNGMLVQRAIASISGLVGRLGPYGGFNSENEWAISGMGKLSGFAGKYKQRFASGFVQEFILGNMIKDVEKLYSDEDIRRATGLSKEEYLKRVKEDLANYGTDEKWKESLHNKDGKPYWDTVETFLIFGDSRFRRNKGATYRNAFLKKAKFFAYVDWRMNSTAQYADILLPAKSMYEVWDIRTNPGYHRYANMAQPPQNLKPVGESKSEWEICTMIVEKLQEIAMKKYKETGDKKYIKIPDPTHSKTGYRDLDKVVEEYTKGGHLRTDRDAVELALESVDQFKPNTIETVRKRGGYVQLNDKAGKTSPLYPDKPYNSFENNLFLFERFETLSGRLTYYVDHDRWIEMGAAVPTAKEPIRPKRFPFVILSPHARWSIHSTYKESSLLQRLQRGKPYVMINPEIAKKKGIKDGDEIKIFNDLGEFYAMAKVYPSCPKDAIILEHGWEPFYFKGNKHHNTVNASPLNLLELSDSWGHIKFGGNWDGNQHAYETTVDIEKA